MAFMRIEQETMINFNAAEEKATLYTADPVMIRKMNKLVEENPEQFQSEVHSRYKGEIYSMNYILPKRFIVIRTKDITRTVTEEQKRAASERLKKFHASKSKK